MGGQDDNRRELSRHSTDEEMIDDVFLFLTHLTRHHFQHHFFFSCFQSELDKTLHRLFCLGMVVAESPSEDSGGLGISDPFVHTFGIGKGG